MELYQELLAHALAEDIAEHIMPFLVADSKEIVQMRCYQALNQIKEIIHDDTQSDEECFLKIEKIIAVLEETGSNGGNRHDFG